MSNITKTHKVGIFAIFIAAALIGSVVAFGDNMAYAGGKKKHMIQNKKLSRDKQMNKMHNVLLVQYHY